MKWILLGYVLSSIVTFAVLGWDKRAARRGRRRVSESTLHGLELAGGFPGSLVGQHVFRHKHVKTKYQAVFWLIVTVHAAAWVVWLKGDRFIF